MAEAAGAALAWLRDAALPLWLAHGIDRARGGFHESLDPDTLDCGSDFRRLRVAARQVYVFAQAHRLGLAGADAAVALGIAFLDRRARREDGGYARQFSLDGAVTDETRDLYDHAFVLLALASAAAVLAAAPLRARALALLDYIEARFPHPAGGYLESLPPALPRRQNPHMHLLEACLAAAEAFGEERFLHGADRLVRLWQRHFFQPSPGALAEYFDDALRPLNETGRYVTEPGHHCEWVWLLHWYARLRPGAAAPLRPAAMALLGFVHRHGINPALGTLRDEVWSDGSVKTAGSRLWPQTERLKAEALLPLPGAPGLAAAFAALDRHLHGARRGLWHERLLPDGGAAPGPAPASSLYHLTCGILVAQEATRGGGAA